MFLVSGRRGGLVATTACRLLMVLLLGQAYGISGANEPPDSACSEPVRVISWNIWFGPFRADVRVAAIMDVVAAKQPHVVAFQEVTPVSWRIFLQQNTTDDYEWTAPPKGAAGGSYYTMVGSRKGWSPLRDVQRSQQPSRMGRDLLSVVVGPPDAPLLLGTSHLESETSTAEQAAPSNKRYRQLQTKQALDFLTQAAFAPTTGDFLTQALDFVTQAAFAPATGDVVDWSDATDAIFCGDTNIDERLTDDAGPGQQEVALPTGWSDVSRRPCMPRPVHAPPAAASFPRACRCW
jgi:endonuclease/exonuclease/phosphatase family metal-dependent hydrolase